MNTSKRNQSIDLVRLIAAFGVVTIHIPFSTEAGQVFNDIFSPLCVPFFYVSSLTFFISSLGRKSDTSEIIKKAATRLLVPYLAWTTIYTGLLLTKHLITHNDSEFVWWKILLYGNSAVQLYFVPQLFAMQMVVLSFFLLFGKETRTAKVLGLIVLSLASAYFIFGNIHHVFGSMDPGHLIIYMLSAWLISNLSSKQAERSAPVYAGLALISLSVWLTFFNHNPSVMFLKYVPWGGVGLLLTASFYRIERLPRLVKLIALTSYGVYLSHVLFLESIQFLTPKILHYEFTYDFPSKVAFTIVVFSLSAFLTLMMRKFPFISSLFLGERGGGSKSHVATQEKVTQVTLAAKTETQVTEESL